MATRVAKEIKNKMSQDPACKKATGAMAASK